tara:strand:+ start:122 stop:1222 length:1101 start_codon:yes stop_codon:yes gene_type:complete
MRNALFISLIVYLSCSNRLFNQLNSLGENKPRLKEAIEKVSPDQRSAMKWLISHMPEADMQNLSSDYLITNSEYAFKAKNYFEWGKKVPDKIFLNYVLPYASLNERRDEWRKDFFYKFSPIVKNSISAYEAAATLNNEIFEMVGVKYSTNRPKADQSPYESIEAGLASCTGLSFLLINACRSVGIPARFIGTPMWYNDSGNHSWVEIWDGEWHFTGAAEPVKSQLNQVWFSDLASKAKTGDMKYGIFAATWNKTELHFPMDWLPGIKKYNAVDVTGRYINQAKIDSGLVAISIRAINDAGERESVNVIVTGERNYFFEGQSRDETYDTNDHLTVFLPKGRVFNIISKNDSQIIEIENECIISLSTN